MMNTAVEKQKAMPALAISENELIGVLQDSVYPGAKLESIKMVIAVCRAAGKDPLKKPYHIVPMSVATGAKDSQGYDIKKMRDVIMPGINDYRTDAARTGQHAGTSEPEFGADITEVLDGLSMTYPKWCKVTVKRKLAAGEIVEFIAKELWKENYATKSNKSDAPNAMWKRRPYAQIAKCAEAQALRKGFPEVGSQPTADEMEGKEIDVTPNVVYEKPAPTYYTDDEVLANENGWKKVIANGKTPDRFIAFIESKGKLFTADQKMEILSWEKKPVVIENEAAQDDFVSQMNQAESEQQ